MSNDVAVKVDGVSKAFKLPHEKHTSIKGLFVNMFRRKRTYERQQVLKNVSFEIKRGEFFGIVGRNGSGKSTLLKLLAGIYEPDKGSLHINGKLTPFIELGVGFNPELTGRENVYLNGALLGFNRNEMDALYDEIVAFAELEKFMDQKLKNYSSGMQVRLAFSIAIRAKSDILLIDEVLAVGDARFQKKCFDYFAQLKRDRVTVVFVSHDSEAVLSYCDRGVFIDDGNKIFEGSASKLVDMYKDSLIKIEDRELSKGSNNKKAVKPIEIIDCYTLDKNDNKVKEYTFGETVRIGLDVRVRQKITGNLNIAIGVYNDPYETHGDRVFGASTQLDKMTIPATSQQVKLDILTPTLRNGEYIIYATLFGNSETVPYDYLREATSFKIKGAPSLSSRGVIISEHKWGTK